jgi:hypothetical protein
MTVTLKVYNPAPPPPSPSVTLKAVLRMAERYAKVHAKLARMVEMDMPDEDSDPVEQTFDSLEESLSGAMTEHKLPMFSHGGKTFVNLQHHTLYIPDRPQYVEVVEGMFAVNPGASDPEETARAVGEVMSALGMGMGTAISVLTAYGQGRLAYR